MYGWRGRVGFITPSHAIVRGHEFEKIAPPGVNGIETRVLTKQDDGQTPQALTKNVIDDMVEQLDRAAAELATAEVDVIAQCGTPVGFMGGSRYHEDVEERIAETTGIPAISMMGSVLESMEYLDVDNVYLTTYYTDEFTESLVSSFEEYDISVLGSSRLQIDRPVDFGKMHPERIYDFVIENLDVDTADLDCLFLGGGGLRTVEIIDPLERDLDVTVVSSSVATFWNALRTIRVHEPISEYGTLLRSLSD